MLAAISQEFLACRAGPSGAGFWQMSSRWHSDQPRPQTRNVFIGLRRELHSVFQYAYQFVTHFEGRVGRVWAFVVREFRIAWALLPFAKGELSRPWSTTVHDADPSLSRMGVAALAPLFTVVKSVGLISEGADACNFETPWCLGGGGRPL